ncbi:MAG: TIGR03905 family TSCPD domain-containing protein [Clostridiaceae bacterium]
MTKYKTKGVCCSEINFKIEEDIIKEVSFEKGCNGNLSGIAALIINMKIQDVIEKLDGIKCGHRDTSCPDQLAQALKSIAK